MAASLDTQAELNLTLARSAQIRAEIAQRRHHEARLRFIRDARAAGWGWTRIGDSLDLTDRGAAHYWENYRMEASRLGDAGAQDQDVD